MTLALLSNTDPITISVASSIAGLSFNRSDLSNTITLIPSAANILTLSGTLNATGFNGIIGATTPNNGTFYNLTVTGVANSDNATIVTDAGTGHNTQWQLNQNSIIRNLFQLASNGSGLTLGSYTSAGINNDPSGYVIQIPNSSAANIIFKRGIDMSASNLNVGAGANYMQMSCSDGIFAGNGLANFVAYNNGKLLLLATGAVFSRNIADTSTALTINQAHASSTGKILDLQFTALSKFSVNYTGDITTTGALNCTNANFSGLVSTNLGLTVANAKTTLAAATTSYASLTLPPTGVAPTTKTPGDMWYDSTQYCLARNNGSSGNTGLVIYDTGVIMSNKAVGTAVALTTAGSYYSVLVAANLMPGSITLPANWWQIGKTLKLEIQGVLTTTGTGTFTSIFILQGMTLACTTPATTTINTGASYNVNIVWTLQCTSLGSTPRFSSACFITVQLNTAAGAAAIMGSFIGNVAGSNSTSTMTVDSQASCSVGAAASFLPYNILLTAWA